MSAEKELREQLINEIGVRFPEDYPATENTAIDCAEAVLALLPPPDVLSWVSAHPEAAKGLAEGNYIAVPKDGGQ